MKQRLRNIVLSVFILLFLGSYSPSSFNLILLRNDTFQNIPSSAEILPPLNIFDWGTLSGTYPNFINGSGTFSQPYYVHDAIIDAQNSDNGIYIGSGADTEYIVIRNCTIYNGLNNANYGGIRIDSASNILIENCTIFGQANGIRLTQTKNVTLRDNQIHNNGIGILINTYCYNTTIIQNNCSNNPDKGIMVNSYSLQNSITSNLLFYNGRGVCIGEANFTVVNGNNFYNTQGAAIELSSAFNNSILNNEIWNSTSTYLCNIVWSDNNTIAGNKIINSTLPSSKGVYLSDSHLNKIRNNTIIETDTAIFNINSQANHIQNNSIRNNSKIGIDCQNSEWSLIENNTIKDTFKLDTYTNCYGINLYQSNFSRINFNTVNSQMYGIKSILSNNVSISNNSILNDHFSDTGSMGISVTYSENNSMYGNSIQDFGYGIWIAQANFTRCIKNFINSTDMYGIHNSGTYNSSIENNNVQYVSSIDGIRTEYSYNVSIQYNLVETCGNYGISIAYSENGTVSWNNCSNFPSYAGISVMMGASGLNFYHNYLNNSAYGFSLSGSQYNDIAFNKIRSYSVNAFYQYNNNDFIHDNDEFAILIQYTINASKLVVNASYQFDASSSIRDIPSVIAWDFGDGSPIETTFTPVHMFNESKQYDLTITLIDNLGEIGILNEAITINPNSIPSLNMILNGSKIYTNDSIKFALSILFGDDPYSIQWDFGDNTANSSEASPLHKYSENGNYTVICMLIDLNGDVAFSNVTIEVVNFTIQDNPETNDVPSNSGSNSGTNGESNNTPPNEPTNPYLLFFQQPLNQLLIIIIIAISIFIGLGMAYKKNYLKKDAKKKKEKKSSETETKTVEFNF